ncbi:MAG TPA: SDR family NAD(P)-dependent oxidoreductase [Anaeromyxobacteraceae bacterium]|nr:SDR family NAD(P)-dependent oxidoreductase [Anaeromyxobacteraceae bacterium]
MTEPLRDRVALVTGGNRGIGRATALALGRAGAHVAVHCREHQEEAEQVADALRALGRRAAVVRADLASADAAGPLLASVHALLGPVEILVNNAGVATPRRLEEVDLALWEETLAVNLRSAFLVSQAVIPSMRQRRFGRLIFVSSTAAQVGGIVGPHYAASKAGLLGLMHAYASQLASEGITANAVAPALVETEMLKGNAKARPGALPVGRFGRPAEVAEVIVAVACNGFLTGQTLQVNGGLYPT